MSFSAAEVIYEAVDADANIIFGALIDDKVTNGEVHITVLATGFATDFFDAESEIEKGTGKGLESLQEDRVKTLPDTVKAARVYAEKPIFENERSNNKNNKNSNKDKNNKNKNKTIEEMNKEGTDFDFDDLFRKDKNPKITQIRQKIPSSNDDEDDNDRNQIDKPKRKGIFHSIKKFFSNIFKKIGKWFDGDD